MKGDRAEVFILDCAGMAGLEELEKKIGDRSLIELLRADLSPVTME